MDIKLLIAARAYTGKNQKELAEIAGLDPSTLASIEAGRSNATAKTEKRLLAALEKCGVEIRDGGVRPTHDRLRILEGDDCYLRLLDDVLEKLEGTEKPELLIFMGDDAVSPPAVIEKYRAIRAAGIRMRQLVEEGNTQLMGELHEYRYVPKEFYINRVRIVYGDCFAYVQKSDVKRVIISADAGLAAAERNQFLWSWETASMPERSDAAEKF